MIAMKLITNMKDTQYFHTLPLDWQEPMDSSVCGEYVRSYFIGSRIVQTKSRTTFIVRSTTKGPSTSVYFTSTLLIAIELFMTLTTRQIFENRAANVVVKPIDTSQGNAIQALDAPLTLVVESSMDNGMIELPRTKQPKQNVYKNSGCETLIILLRRWRNVQQANPSDVANKMQLRVRPTGLIFDRS
mmetsp:Transcript_19502/g.29436  ORF Transcript_19502/g.29436 Transcript_19502/m.29436 type:complete len:187 (-) Transcript_19502:1174-1734(-)